MAMMLPMRIERSSRISEAGDVIRRDRLHAETETDGEGAAEHRQRGDVDADQRQADEQRDDDEYRLAGTRDHNTDIRVDALRTHQAMIPASPRTTARDEQCTECGHDAMQDQPEVELLLADRETDGFERRDRRRKARSGRAPGSPRQSS